MLIAIPVTLALTLFMFFLYGYTLNRITLFALIFSIGILVDDAIVVVENIVRHARLPTGESRGLAAIALRAVDEVGNPTILATLTVVAAILPMAFVGGLMGPYMRPIPVGASAAMVFSLVVAFVVTPWAAVRLLKPVGSIHDHGEEDLLHAPLPPRDGSAHRERPDARALSRRRGAAAAGRDGARAARARHGQDAAVRQQERVPGDGRHARRARRSRRRRASRRPWPRPRCEDAAVVNVQQYVGTSAPYNFNGLVRHYFLRQAPHLADLQVNLVPKDERSAQSHDVARRVRDRLLPIAPIVRRHAAGGGGAARPAGPADPGGRESTDRSRRGGSSWPRRSRRSSSSTPGVVDTDWYVEAPHAEGHARRGRREGRGRRPVAGRGRLGGPDGRRAATSAGLLHDAQAREDVPIVIRLPRARRAASRPSSRCG